MSLDVTHRIVELNGGIRIHLVEQGSGPLVLFVHGFPESWYSWRHQLPVVAEAGFRAVAIDVRGYGRSSAPLEVDAYRMMAHVGDNVGVVKALGEDQAIIVGHDWGSPIAANSALLRPDLFKAVALLSVPFAAPGGPTRPTDAFRRMGGEEQFYIDYFQEPGVAEAEIEPDVRHWLTGMLIGASGDALTPEDKGVFGLIPRGGLMKDRFAIPETLPSWLSEEDIDFYTEQFEYSGFRGPLNRYRNVDRDWLDLQGYKGKPIEVPSLFIGGELDGPTMWGGRALAAHSQTMPGIRGSHILAGCGHWLQQERPDEVNHLLLDWLKGL